MTLPEFLALDGPLRIEQFFQTLYFRYDECYVYAAPDLKHFTRRNEWAQASPVFDSSRPEAAGFPALDYPPRIADKPLPCLFRCEKVKTSTS